MTTPFKTNDPFLKRLALQFPKRKCGNCGKKYQPLHRRHKFCSVACSDGKTLEAPVEAAEWSEKRLRETRERIVGLKDMEPEVLPRFLLTRDNLKDRPSRDAICILIRHHEGRLYPIDRKIAGDTL